jgi:CHASE2 domain-containing sensor protein
MKNPLKRWDVFLTLVFFLLAIPAERMEVFAVLEDQSISYRHILRQQLGDPAYTSLSEDIILVSLDEELYEEYGSFPFRRTDLGKIANTLGSLGASVVGLDFLMDFKSSYGEDGATAEYFENAGNVVLVSYANFEGSKFVKLTYPTSELAEHTRSGYSNLAPTSALVDNLARLRIHKQITNNEDGWPFAVQVLALHLGEEPRLEGNQLRLGDEIEIPLDQYGDVYIDFPLLPAGTRYLSETGFSALEILEMDDMDAEELEEMRYLFEGKIVLVGDTWEVTHDRFNTPVGQVYGVEIIADTINTLLNGAPLRPAGAVVEIAVSLLFMLLILIGIFVKKQGLRMLLSVAVYGIYVSLVTLAYIYQGLVLSMTYTMLAGFLGILIINLRFYLLSELSQQESAADSAESNRMLGMAYQGQGQLDAAFEKYRRCPRDEATHELLYNLGLDYERKRQFNRAHSIYEYIAESETDYRDVQKRIERSSAMEDAVLLGGGRGVPAGGSLIMNDGSLEKPMLGRYQVEKELGQGAMGVVYLGTDPKINRNVAIKTMALSDEFDADELVEVKERFFREAESAGRLNHANIVSIYDAGEEHDLAYIAMELLKGYDLDKHIKDDSLLPLEKVIEIGIRCAEALDYAHSERVVHRDIKPSNIMYDPKDSTVKITDFGIARITDSSKTRTGTVLGTPNYMSPEQCMGKKVDGRSDLYSLGVVLYQLCSGKLPFVGESMATLMYSIVNDAPVDLKKVKADIPPTLRKVIHNAMGKKVEKRYQTGKKLAEHLNVCLQRLSKEMKVAST